MTEQEAESQLRRLFEEKKLEEGAILATKLYPQFPESLDIQQLSSLILRDSKKYDDAIEIIKSAIKSFPKDGWLWRELGNAYHSLKDYEKAVSAIEVAQDHAPRNKWTWSYSAKIYYELKNYRKQAKALHRLVELDLATPSDLENLGRAYHNQKEYFEALEWYRKAISAGERSLALSNIGALYMTDEISQDADAADAFRRYLETYQSEFAQTRYQQTKEKLLPLATEARAQFPSLNWKRSKHKFYLNPFEVFKLNPDLEPDVLLKKSSKRRKGFLLMADEADGFYDFDGRDLSRDDIVRLADELKDENTRGYHASIYQNPTFHNFLRQGDLDHFLYSEEYYPKATLEYLDANPEFREFLAKPFGEQYSSILCAVVDQFFDRFDSLLSSSDEYFQHSNVLAILEILFDGRRWVNEKEEEGCFYDAYNRIDSRLKQVSTMFARLRDEEWSRNEFESKIKKSGLFEFFNLLPRYFASLQQGFVAEARNTAVALANENDDHETAKVILDQCQLLRFRDQELMDTIKGDLKTLDKLLQQKREHLKQVVQRRQNAPQQQQSAKGESSENGCGCLVLIGIVVAAFIYFSDGCSSDSSSSDNSDSDYSSDYSSNTSRNETRSYSPNLVPPKPVFSIPEQSLPAHGAIAWHNSKDRVAPLQVQSTRGDSYLLRLYDYPSDSLVMSVFIRGGSTLDVKVPLGIYSIKYASGEKWYGDEHLFGPQTSYSKTDSTFNFRENGYQISGFTITLYKTVSGNLSTSGISKDDF